MFSAATGDVHVYDGSAKVQKFNELHLESEHRLALDRQNTFNLSAPHTVVWGMGISFVAAIGFDSRMPDAPLIVASAGGDFFV
jgi:hypothetical protein